MEILTPMGKLLFLFYFYVSVRYIFYVPLWDFVLVGLKQQCVMNACYRFAYNVCLFTTIRFLCQILI